MSPAPILIGPWRSEVGFELLYWIPFLQKFATAYQIDPTRLIAIGRGGSGQWYQTAGHGDVYEHVPVETVRTWSIKASQQTGSMKQYTAEPWERPVCELVAQSLGIDSFHVLSPRWMYRLLHPWWAGQQPETFLDRYTLQPVKYPAPAMSPELRRQLPERYVAMRWYARPTWPYQEALNLWTRTFIEKVASQMPVVILDSFHADDHADIHLGNINNTIRLSEITDQTPTDNLLIQSAVIARAKAYVGTYGGMAQGAMRWGVPTVALYAEFGQTAQAHLTLTQSLSLKTGVPFIVAQPKDLEGALSMVFGNGKSVREKP
jgi:hypothetical protein